MVMISYMRIEEYNEKFWRINRGFENLCVDYLCRGFYIFRGEVFKYIYVCGLELY